MRALLSVWDKTGLVEFASGLAALGVDLVASGGTATALTQASIVHQDVADVTGFPEMLGGRVKTLHPRIHGGILADRSKTEHMASLDEHDIEPIDLVVCNLYPFSSDPSVELIDIGGPAMVRAAAKNHQHVGVLTNPAQYPDALAELEATGSLSNATRHQLARAAFAHTAAYDAQIVRWLDGGGVIGEAPSAVDDVVPATLHLTLERADVVRYGENPHQIGARYRTMGSTPWWDGVVQHAGSALSYLNLFDADAAWRLVHELKEDFPGFDCVAIIKHANASGAALGSSLDDAFAKALAADPQSAFGGVVAIGGVVGRGSRQADLRRPPGRRHYRLVLRRGRHCPARGPSKGHPSAERRRPGAPGPLGADLRRHRAGAGRGRAARAGAAVAHRERGPAFGPAAPGPHGGLAGLRAHDFQRHRARPRRCGRGRGRRPAVEGRRGRHRHHQGR